MEYQTVNMAMFPLSTFLLPGEEIPLRIFEPRYIQLINDCEKTGMTFGIPYIEGKGITNYGSEVELQNTVAKNSLNEMVIMVKGLRNFHLLNFRDELPGKLYGGGIIEYLNDQFHTHSPELAVLIKKLKLDVDPMFGTLPKTESYNLTDIAKSIMLTSEDKFKFYSLRNQFRMEQFLITRLKYYELIKKQEEKLENNFMLN